MKSSLNVGEVRKRLPDMSYEQIGRVVSSINEALSDAKDRLDAARQAGARHGKFIPSDRYRQMQRRVRDLGALCQEAQTQRGVVGRRERAKKQKEWERRFVDAARLYLPVEEFREISRLASRNED